MNALGQRILGALSGFVASVLSDGPWRSRSVRAAAAVAFAGLAFWVYTGMQAQDPAAGIDPEVHPNLPSAPASPGWAAQLDRPVPGYVRVSLSYVGGFLIGWAFRSFLKLIATGVVILGSLVGMGKFAGWDTDPLQSRIEQQASGLKARAEQTRDHLRGMLPSSTAAGTGAVFGWRRRSKAGPQVPRSAGE